jgi:hypothetical protein
MEIKEAAMGGPCNKHGRKKCLRMLPWELAGKRVNWNTDIVWKWDTDWESCHDASILDVERVFFYFV